MIIHNNGIIKCQLKDFIVNEKINLSFFYNFYLRVIKTKNLLINNLKNLLESGNFLDGNNNYFLLFILRKENATIFNVLLRLSKIFKIPISDFLFLGEKDKYAVTYQSLFVRLNPKNKEKIIDAMLNNFDDNLRFESCNKDFILSFIGIVYNNLDSLKKVLLGNEFLITIRKIPIELQDFLIKRLKILEADCLPNYYDIQRFGKRLINHLIGLALNNKMYYEASYLLLCVYSNNENSKVKSKRRKIKELLLNNKIDEVMNLRLPQYMDIEKVFLSILLKERNYKKAWKNFPYKFTTIFKDAYKSFIFNCKLNHLIKQSILNHSSDFISKKIQLNIPENEKDFINQNIINKINNKEVKEIFKNWDNFEFIFPKNLDLIIYDEKYENYRDYFIRPILKEISLYDDEIFENHKKLKVKFFLPKGSFATNLFYYLLN
jgi:TruD family tRNA pseudouridine synthase